MLPDGTYVLHVDGMHDGAGDEVDDYSVPFIVGAAPDETAPTVSFSAAPSGFRTMPGASFSFGTNDGTATLQCSNDNAAYAPCASPASHSYAEGAHTFRVFARDPAGNESSVATASWTYRPPPHGYWMVGAGGAVYQFGTVQKFGSAQALGAVDVEATPSGFGYWIVDRAGHVFSFGDARYFGGAGSMAAGETVTSISRTPTGKGYWLFTTRGRVFSRGDAHFYGDMSKVALERPGARLGRDAVRARLLRGRVRRRRLHVRRREVRGFNREPAPGRAGAHAHARSRRHRLLARGYRRRGVLVQGGVPRLDGRQALEPSRSSAWCRSGTAT